MQYASVEKGCRWYWRLSANEEANLEKVLDRPLQGLHYKDAIREAYLEDAPSWATELIRTKARQAGDDGSAPLVDEALGKILVPRNYKDDTGRYFSWAGTGTYKRLTLEEKRERRRVA